MNSLYRIIIEVAGARQAAQSINEVSAAVSRSSTATKAAAAGTAADVKTLSSSIHSALSGLGDKFDQIQKSSYALQRSSRQLMTAFTLPIGAVFGIGVGVLFKQQEALVRLQNTYGKLTDSQAQVRAETGLLDKAFTILSGHLGVNKAQLLDAAAQWAQAGATSVGLAKDVRTSAEAALLSGQDIGELTTKLIGLAQSWGLNGQQVHDTLEMVNAASDNSKVSVGDYLDILNQLGPIARTAGIDQQHLIAMVSSITPSAGSAEGALTKLRQIITRLLDPSKASIEAMKAMGLNVETAGWQSKTATERLKDMAAAFVKLTPAQQNLVDLQVSSRFAVQGFAQMMRDLNDPMGQYAKTLQATNDKTLMQKNLQEDLQNILKSNPQALKILITQLENLLAQAVVPLIPALLWVVNVVKQAVEWFSNLDPGTQKLIMLFLALVAVVPVAAYVIGAFGNLIGTTGKAVSWFLGLIGLMGPAVSKEAAASTAAGATVQAAIGEMQAAVTEMLAGIQAAVAEVVAALEGIAAQLEVIIAQMAGSVAASQELVPAAAAPAATATATFWVTAAGTVMKAWEAAMSAVAGMQALPAAGAAAGAIGAGGASAAVPALGPAGAAAGGAFTTGAAAAIGAGAPVIAASEATVIEMVEGLDGVWVAAGTLGGSGLIAGIGEAIAAGVGAVVAAVGAVPLAIAAAVVAAGVLIYAFRSQIVDALSSAWEWVVRNAESAWGGLVSIIQSALTALIQTIEAPIKFIADMLSYLNPFAHHSPSLVENVMAGVDLIASKYATLGNIGSLFRQGVADIQAFGAATRAVRNQAYATDIGQQRDEIVNGPLDKSTGTRLGSGAGPGAGAAFDRLQSSIARLESELPGLQAKFNAQQEVVLRWADALQRANDRLADESSYLKELQRDATAASDALSAAKATLDTLNSTVPTGMIEAQDAMFANDQAQKALQLQILQMSDAAGMSLDKAKSKIAALQGSIEGLQAQVKTLREAGAGSDVLGPYLDQIKAMQGEQGKLGGVFGPNSALDDAQRKLDEMKSKGEELNLEFSLTFDPMTRQLEKARNQVAEMPFADLLAKTQSQVKLVADLTKNYDAATAAVHNQQVVVDQLTEKRDEIQKTYDEEKKKLDEISNAYDGIEKQVGDMKSAISDMVSLLDKQGQILKANKDKTSDFMKQFNLAGQFDQPGGPAGQLAKETGDMNKLIDDWLKQMKNKFGGFKLPNPFSAFKGFIQDAKDAWDWYWKGLKGDLGAIGGWFKGLWHNVENWGGNAWDGIKRAAAAVWASIQQGGENLWNGLSVIAHLVWTGFTTPFVAIAAAAAAAWGVITAGAALTWQDIQSIGGLIGGMFAGLWSGINAGANAVWGGIEAGALAIWSVLSTVGSLAAGMFSWLWSSAVRGADALWGDVQRGTSAIWSAISTVGGWIANLFSGLWNNIMRGADIAWGWIRGGINGVGQTIAAVAGWIGNTLSGLWNGLAWAAYNAWQGVGAVIRSGINVVISLIDYFIRAIDNIQIHVPSVSIGPFHSPGFDWNGLNIPQIRYLAAGGVTVGDVGTGFVTNGVRAIVGEGNPSYPEWVIPTDPAYRSNALGLFKGLAGALGLNGMANAQAMAWLAVNVTGAPLLSAGGALGGFGTSVQAPLNDNRPDKSDGKREVHLHIEHLELPNITDPADVGTFIDNLEALAR